MEQILNEYDEDAYEKMSSFVIKLYFYALRYEINIFLVVLTVVSFQHLQ